VPDTYPNLRAVVLDATDARALGEFYRLLLGYEYSPGHGEPDPDGDDWLVLREPSGTSPRLAIQRVDELPTATWPEPVVPQQLHLDMTVADIDELARQHDRALALGATELEDRSADADEPLYVLADPAGHPFCIFVSPDHP
jgi:Glyoxalase-like domain